MRKTIVLWAVLAILSLAALSYAGGGSSGVTSGVTWPVTVPAGLGAVTDLIGPSDQHFRLTAPGGDMLVTPASSFVCTKGGSFVGLTSAPAGSGSFSETYGASSTCPGGLGTVVGSLSSASSNQVVVVGCNHNVSGVRSVGVGYGGDIRGADCVGIGNVAFVQSASQESVVIGSGAAAGTSGGHACPRTVAIGYGTNTGTTDSTDCILIGHNVRPGSGSNAFIAGSSDSNILDVYFGQGVSNDSPSSYTIHGTEASGVTVTGGSLYLSAGRGTDTASSGSLVLRTSLAGTTGNGTLNTAHNSVIVTAGLTTLADNTLLQGRWTVPKTIQTASNGATYAVGSSDLVIFVSAGSLTAGQNYTVQLPNAATYPGRNLIVKTTALGNAAATITYSALGGNVEGVASFTSAANLHAGFDFYSDGTDWWEVSKL